MNRHDLLVEAAIPTPCPVNWADMEGNDRVRFCRSCTKHVYNIASMTSAQAADLFRSNDGDLCARIYRRPDGTIVTADCRPEARSLDRMKALLGNLFGLTALVAAVMASLGIAPPFLERLLPSRASQQNKSEQTGRSGWLAGKVAPLEIGEK